MFNWFDKLLVKIAKKILNKYAPTGEFIAYINEYEEKILKDLGGYGQPVNETGVKSFWGIPEWMKTGWENYKKYKDVIDPVAKTVGSLGKAYIDYKSQKELNELTEEAYNQYMREKQAAGQEAQAAVDLNLTPMQISNVPTTKADVSDFTLVAARGGLMNLPTRQRKRYAFGPNEIDVEAMQEESIGPYELQMEEGVNISPMVEEDKQKQLLKAFAEYQAGGGTLSLQEFAVMWIRENAARTVQGDTQMADLELRISPKIIAEWEADGGASGPYKTPQEYYEAYYGETDFARGGIIGLRHGGRPGYRFGDQVGITAIPRPAMDPRGFRSLPAMATKDGIMDLGGLEKDYRTTGGFVPIGAYEKKDDVPARLSKNEFVMTADAVRAAGGGSINRGAQRMYDTMKHLEASPQSRRMTV